MKRFICTLVLATAFISQLFCQDVINTTAGEAIKAIVKEVGLTEVKYKKFNNPNGPDYLIHKSDILTIQYQNGTIDDFQKVVEENEYVTPGSVGVQMPTAPPVKNMRLQGSTDARSNYDGYKGAGTGTLVTSLVFPLAGLGPAIACSSTPPKDFNLGYPNPELMKNNDYALGYKAEAKKIKQSKVWSNWGIGFGVNLLLFVVITANQ